MTRIGNDHLIAAGAVLEKARRDGTPEAAVARVVVDGVEIDAAAARAAFAEAARKLPDDAAAPGRVERLLDKLEQGADGFEDKLDKTRVGRAVANVLRADPERVTSSSVVELHLAGGATVSVPVEVLHRKATAALQRASIASSLVGMLPLLGQVVHAGTALASGIAALVTLAIGKRHLAEALGETSLKHVTLTGTSFVPLVSTLAASLAVVGDRADLKDLREPARLEDVIGLGG